MTTPRAAYGHAAIAVLLSAFVACTSLPSYRITKLTIPNKAGKLSNGLRLMIQPEPNMAKVWVAVRYNVGAAQDPKDKKGIAHLLEHLAFRLDDEIIEVPPEELVTLAGDESTRPAGEAKATEKKKKKKKKEERVVRYMVGENAHTSMDETFYYKRVLPDHFEDVLEDFAEQMGDWSGRISPTVFETERDVVRNERRSSYETEPLDSFWLDLYDRFYPQDHPYQGHAVIGSHETIQNIELADVGAYLKAHYHPGNATLAVVGPIDEDETLALIMKHFGNKPAREPTPQPKPEWRPQRREEVVVNPELKETHLAVVWPAGPADSKEAIALNLLNRGAGGWFGYRLVTNRGWSYWAYSFLHTNEVESQFVVRTLLRDHDNLAVAKAKILEISQILEGYYDQQDLSQARRRVIYETLYDAEYHSNRGSTMMRYFAKRGVPNAYVDELEELEAMGLYELREIARRVLDPDRAMVLIHTPIDPKATDKRKAKGGATPSYTKEQAEKTEAAPSHENRDTLPKRYEFAQPYDAFERWGRAHVDDLSTAEEIIFDNGITARVAQKGTLPIMAVSVTARGGTLAQPDEMAGLANLTVDSMGLWGRANRNYRWRMGVRGGFDVSTEWITYSQKIPSFYAEHGLRLFSERVFSPQFSNRGLKDQRASYIQSLGEAEKNVDVLGYRAYWLERGMAQLSPVPTKASVQRVGLGDVDDFFEDTFYPENVTVSVVSDRPAAQIKPLLAEYIGSLGRRGEPPRSLTALGTGELAPPQARLILVPVDNSAQTRLLIGFTGAGWHDWKAARRVRAVSTLLDKKADRIREAMGVTYGVNASRWSVRDHGMLWVTTKVDSDAVDSALRTLMRVIEEVRRWQLTEGELDMVRRRQISSLAGTQWTARGYAEHLTEQAVRGRPHDYHAQVIDWLATLTVEQLNAAVQDVLSDEFTVVVAGKAPAEDHPARKLGAVKTYTPEDLL